MLPAKDYSLLNFAYAGQSRRDGRAIENCLKKFKSRRDDMDLIGMTPLRG
jgi:hypothetical protein